MGLSQFVKAFLAAREYVPPDADASKRQVSIHRRVVATSVVSMLVLGGLGTAGVFVSADDTVVQREGPVLYVLGPIAFGAAGMIFGAALGCLFAPRAFLASQAGAKWMRLIGTRNVVIARIVCSILVVLTASGSALLFIKIRS